jgi:hypothetical protein
MFACVNLCPRFPFFLALSEWRGLEYLALPGFEWVAPTYCARP